MCHDKFEQFYNEEREEWHLRAAVRIDGKTYHPLCYDDYKVRIFIINFTDFLLLLLKAHIKIKESVITLTQFIVVVITYTECIVLNAYIKVGEVGGYNPYTVYCVALKCIHTYIHTYLLTYLLTCLLHGAESFLRS